MFLAGAVTLAARPSRRLTLFYSAHQKASVAPVCVKPYFPVYVYPPQVPEPKDLLKLLNAKELTVALSA